MNTREKGIHIQGFSPRQHPTDKIYESLVKALIKCRVLLFFKAYKFFLGLRDTPIAKNASYIVSITATTQSKISFVTLSFEKKVWS
jgi:hypothetical protein